MSRGFVVRAVLGVLFAAASFAGAIVAHPGEREDARARLRTAATGFADAAAASRCPDDRAPPSRSADDRAGEGDASRRMLPQRHCEPVHG